MRVTVKVILDVEHVDGMGREPTMQEVGEDVVRRVLHAADMHEMDAGDDEHKVSFSLVLRKQYA